MNNKKIRMINKLINDSFDYLDHLCKEYDLYKVSFIIFNSSFIHHESSKIEWVRTTLYRNDIRMLTVSTPRTNADSECPHDDEIIEDVIVDIYISNEQLYFLLIECNLDFDKAFECMKFGIRHEVGHIINIRKSYIGAPIRIWKKSFDEYSNHNLSLPKLRKNASNKSVIQWTLKYLEIPMEKAANEAVGITKDDIIKNCERTLG